MLYRKLYFVVMTISLLNLRFPATAATGASQWVAASDRYTEMLLAVRMKHHPEMGSRQGLSEYDTNVSQPTLADEQAERREAETVLARLKTAATQVQPTEVKQDLEILTRRNRDHDGRPTAERKRSLVQRGACCK